MDCRIGKLFQCLPILKLYLNVKTKVLVVLILTIYKYFTNNDTLINSKSSLYVSFKIDDLINVFTFTPFIPPMHTSITFP